MSPTDNRTSVIAYETVNNLGSLSWLGFRPRISNQMNINCPFQGLARANFIMAIQGRGNNATKSLGNGPSKSVGGNGFGGIGILAKQ